ncbi:PaaX family transcriptional regulator [Sphingomonas soli]|uniref:PaaX family transcriptional regulator n=1 Tax=Sphingomonas soli TaxID=266127 RepID=UPI000A0556A4|nr:PaaX family transcriptional regulator C-terminal domain-containing protein [Sphingomonas soli]
MPSIDMPRPQTGSQPQRLIMTLLSHYWDDSEEFIPPAAIIRLLEDFDITALSTRAALRRLVQRGALENAPSGRRRGVRLPEHYKKSMARTRERLRLLGPGAPPWDGLWTVAMFSLPEADRDVRHAAKSRLQWIGLAPLFDGFWVTSLDLADAVKGIFEDLGITEFLVMRASAIPGGRQPASAWNFDDARNNYLRFIDQFAPLRERVRSGSVGAQEALLERTNLMNEWRIVRHSDPLLPAELLPADWPRNEALALLEELHDSLAPLAIIRFRQVLEETAADLVQQATFRTFRSNPAGKADPADRKAPQSSETVRVRSRAR